ncbi:MAG: hypothetical protein ABEJ42_00990 [Halobacteriaceae archaeon]
MRRRPTLRLLGSGLSAAGLAGCVGLGTSSGNPSAMPTSTAPSCPTIAEGVDRTVCAGDSPSDLPVVSDQRGTYLVDPVEESAVPGDVVLTLENRADRRFVVDPKGWSLHRAGNGTLEQVAVGGGSDERARVRPGGTYEWFLRRVDHPGAIPAENRTYDDIGELDPGRYVFAVDGELGSGDPLRVECHAAFRIETASGSTTV